MQFTSMRRGALVALVAVAPLTACSPGEFTKAEKGGVVGAVIGGVAGGVVSNSVRGTLIGAVLGGVAGAIIGKVMDVRADKLAADLRGASVDRVGEGVAIAFDDDAFEAGSARLNTKAERDLTKVAQQLRNDEGVEAIVIGHADDDALALKRARAAEDFLEDKGVDSSRVKAKAGGDGNAPLEIALVATEEAKARAKREAKQRG